MVAIPREGSSATRRREAAQSSPLSEYTSPQLKEPLQRRWHAVWKLGSDIYELALQWLFASQNNSLHEAHQGQAPADFDFFRHYFDAGLLNEGIFNGADQEANELLNEEISVFQTAMEFLRAHTTDEAFQPTEKARHGECPLAGACQAPLAIDSTRSHICRRTPWESYDLAETNNCAYGTGVKVTWAGHPVIRRSDAV